MICGYAFKLFAYKMMKITYTLERNYNIQYIDVVVFPATNLIEQIFKISTIEILNTHETIFTA